MEKLSLFIYEIWIAQVKYWLAEGQSNENYFVIEFLCNDKCLIKLKCQATEKWKFKDSAKEMMVFSTEDQKLYNIIKTFY